MARIRVTEYLDIDLKKEVWRCNRCDAELSPARDSYLKGCLVYERPSTEVYGPPSEVGEGAYVSYAPDPNLIRMLEFYCPECGSMVEVQYLPPGHPIPHDIELNIDKLKEKYLQ